MQKVEKATCKSRSSFLVATAVSVACFTNYVLILGQGPFWQDSGIFYAGVRAGGAFDMSFLPNGAYVFDWRFLGFLSSPMSFAGQYASDTVPIP
jgi:hypothetical protein